MQKRPEGESTDAGGPAGPARSRQSTAAPVLQLAYDLLLWLIPTIDRMPRSRRFTIGERIESSSLELLEFLTEAAYSKDRAVPLAGANRALQRLRLLMRAAKDLRVLDTRRYEFAARRVDEIGRMVGGWMRAGNRGTS